MGWAVVDGTSGQDVSCGEVRVCDAENSRCSNLRTPGHPCFGTALVAGMFVVSDIMPACALYCATLFLNGVPTCAIVRHCHDPPHPGTKSGMASYATNCHTVNRRMAPSAHASPRNERLSAWSAIVRR